MCLHQYHCFYCLVHIKQIFLDFHVFLLLLLKMVSGLILWLPLPEIILLDGVNWGSTFFFLVQCTFLEDSCSSRCLLTLKAEIFLSILHRLQEGFSAFGEMWRKIRQVSHWKITSFFPNLGKTNPNLKGISFLFFKVRSRLKRGLKTTKSVMSSL